MRHPIREWRQRRRLRRMREQIIELQERLDPTGKDRKMLKARERRRRTGTKGIAGSK